MPKSAVQNWVTQPVPQTEKTLSRQVLNNAGGYVFTVSEHERLIRFLVLGTDKGTYYASERDITKENVDFLLQMIKGNEVEVVDTVVDVSVNARAPKNSNALFVLALVFVHGQNKAYVRTALPKVARTATHLFEFMFYLKSMGGLGRSKRKAIADWYTSKEIDDLAYQIVKYRNRHGFTHKDAIALSHPKHLPHDVVAYLFGREYDVNELPQVIQDFLKAQKMTKVKDAVALIKTSSLPWEAFSTDLHKEPTFWKALVEKGMGQTALLRNVTRFHKLDLFKDLDFVDLVATQLSDQEKIVKGRLHPVNYLNALGMYRKISGYNARIAGALENGYLLAFKNVEPANKRTLIALDVSGSMGWDSPAGLVGMTAREASAAMMQVTLCTEPKVHVVAFTSKVTPLDVSTKDSLEALIARVSYRPLGSTDVGAAIQYAISKNLEVDTFVIYTDNETYYGPVHVHKLLEKYRRQSGIQARLIVVGMTATPYSVVDDEDPNSLNVVGFDLAAPGVIADFSARRI